jgi:hypothetical protein
MNRFKPLRPYTEFLIVPILSAAVFPCGKDRCTVTLCRSTQYELLPDMFWGCDRMIVIVTTRADLHAVAIRGRIKDLGYKDCYIVECDYRAQGNFLYYTVGITGSNDRVNTSDGRNIPISEASLIWLRRFRANQILTYPLVKEDLYDLVNSDCRGALSGYLLSKFKGKWISHPEATIRSSDKVYQLEIANRSGFRVPKTVIAQCSSDVAELYRICGGQIIVKPIVGADQQFLETRRITSPDDYSEDSYNACPSLYQEYIDGTKHLRLLSMAHKSLCGIIETERLDWRMDPTVKVVPWPVPDDVHVRVRNVLESLGLEMGIVDIKLTSEGELVWFEVNPQGQFLFLEPLTRIPFIDEFSKYLIDEAKSMLGK